MSKFFKSKSKQITIPDTAKSELPPRTQEEIDKEYTQLCITIGDRTVKSRGLEEELEQMFRYANKLGAESARRQELNKKEQELTQASNVVMDSTDNVVPAL